MGGDWIPTKHSLLCNKHFDTWQRLGRFLKVFLDLILPGTHYPLDTRKGNYIKMLFYDYSSTLYTTISFKLTNKLEGLGSSLSVSVYHLQLPDCRHASPSALETPRVVSGDPCCTQYLHSSICTIVRFADDTTLLSTSWRTCHGPVTFTPWWRGPVSIFTT